MSTERRHGCESNREGQVASTRQVATTFAGEGIEKCVFTYEHACPLWRTVQVENKTGGEHGLLWGGVDRSRDGRTHSLPLRE